MSDENIKIVIVGDASIDKSCLIRKYADQQDSQSRVLMENVNKNVIIDGHSFQLYLVNTAGQEPYHRLRRLAYHIADICIILFSMQDKATFRTAKQKWFPEVKEAAPSAKILFVGVYNPRKAYRVQQMVDVSQMVILEHLRQKTGVNCYFQCFNLTASSKQTNKFFQNVVRQCKLEIPSYEQGQSVDSQLQSCTCQLI